MADIQMIKHHSLPLAAARALVQKAADGLAEEYNLSSRWAGDTLHFNRTGVHGEMKVTPSEIQLEVTLGFLLKVFKANFVEHIEKSFETLLAKAHAAHKPASKSKAGKGDGVRAKTSAKAAGKTRKS